MVCGIYILTDFDKIENILVVDYPSETYSLHLMRLIRWFLSQKTVVQFACVDKRVVKGLQVCGKIQVTDIVARKDNSIDNFIKDTKKGMDHITRARKKIMLAAPHVKVHRAYLELTEEETGIAKTKIKKTKTKNTNKQGLPWWSSG